MFITFEGCDGSGKSTQIAFAKQYLESIGRTVVVTREPGGTMLAEKLRAIILDPTSVVGARAEAMLYATARVQHVNEIIKPALERGAVVRCDRSIDSSMAYQGKARGIGMEWVRTLFDQTCGLLPDATVWLDISARDAFLRKGGIDSDDRIEREGEAFAALVYEGYKEIAASEPERVHRIDASGTKEDTRVAIRALLEQLCARS